AITEEQRRDSPRLERRRIASSLSLCPDLVTDRSRKVLRRDDDCVLCAERGVRQRAQSLEPPHADESDRAVARDGEQVHRCSEQEPILEGPADHIEIYHGGDLRSW